MTEAESNRYVPVSRELVWAGILPWAGRRYESKIKNLFRDHPYDPLVLMVPERLLEVYRDHAPANERMTASQATRLGLDESGSEGPNSFLNKLRRALGNPS
jgi:hypothetical protein